MMIVLGVVAMAAARPSDIIDIEEDHLEHEQEGVPGTAVEGEYSWVAPDGNEYKIKYVADHFGYRVVEDNVVPQFRALEVADPAPKIEEEEEDEEPVIRDSDMEEEEMIDIRAAEDMKKDEEDK
ncbi:Cuticle protein [Homarus americanus]|uniref:Cuticle protein n=2 Tax=Homarus americanus TaxID=6706 RepID=A0A8J5KMY1_HOMAM|nr:Cuticle protein [Homarus americanus]